MVANGRISLLHALRSDDDYTDSSQPRAPHGNRRREHMVGVNMVLAEYLNTIKF